MGFFEDFKKFISKGNVMDMAIGVIIGGAFNTIVQTLNKKILMPIVDFALSALPGTQNGLYTIMLNSKRLNTEGLTPEQISMAQASATLGPDGNYYTVLNYIDWSSLFESIFNFLFIALTLFIILKVTKYLADNRIKLQDIIPLNKDNTTPTKPKEEIEEEKVEKLDPQIELLMEIRDVLKSKDEAKIEE